MDSSKLNKKIIFQAKPDDQKDESGYPIEKWVDVFDYKISAARIPLSGREYFAAAAVQAENTVRFEIRYREGIDSYMRIICDKRIYDIKSVIDDVKGDKTETHIMAIENPNETLEGEDNG